MTDSTEIKISKNSRKPVLLSLLILVSGIIIGSGMTLIVINGPDTVPSVRMPEEMSRRMFDNLIAELKLDEAQQEQIRPVLAAHFRAMHEIRMEARPRIAQELREMNDLIMNILDEQQKEIWQTRLARMGDFFPRDGRGPGRGPGTGPGTGERSRGTMPPYEGQRPLRNREPEPEQTPFSETNPDAVQQEATAENEEVFSE